MLGFLLALNLSAAEEQQAELKISGYGLWGNLEVKRTLKSLDLRWKEREFFDANFVEDAALIAMSQLRKDGYLNAKISINLLLEDGSELTRVWGEYIEPPLPRPLRIRRAELEIMKGLLYRYGKVEIEGSTVLSEKEAKSFFIEQGVLLPLKQTRIYTPQKLENGLKNMEEVLARRGYESADVTFTNLTVNDASGKVDVSVRVNEGKKSVVRSVREEIFSDTNALPIAVKTIQTNADFSAVWEQDYAQRLRATNYHLGYPDAKVELTPLRREPVGDHLEVDLLAKTITGRQVALGDVRFEGLNKTKPSVVKRQVRLKEGEPLDRVEAEQGRHRLAKLGIFDFVGMRYDRVDEDTRNVVYTVKEGKRVDVSLLAGYGSYELVRAGVEVEQFNIFGRAHHAKWRMVQSMKSTSVDFLYTMPQFIGEEVDMFLDAFYLRREEISFTREEFGGGAGARTFLDVIASDFSARYNYEILSAFDADVTEGPTNVAVSAVILELKHDRRDNPLYPRRGYKVATSMETATEYLGGDVNFMRFETRASYHQPLEEGRWMHFGLSHGVIVTFGSPQDNLPFNKRFFPGGDNSVRGFQYGEAAPLDADGNILGAETYTTGNIEFEQALTAKFSFVAFVDAIGFALRTEDYPFDDYLVSVGGGLRWKTIVGPIRLEYGYNVVRRDPDPMGTIHFSIGFPF